MSLGDYIRYLRAMNKGITPWEIEAATGIPSGLQRQIEQRYRAVGNEEEIRKLAEFFGVPVEELRWRQEWSRKKLSQTLAITMEKGEPITLELRTGEIFQGRIEWWDLGAFGLRLEDGSLVVVQRHIVDKWEPVYQVE